MRRKQNILLNMLGSAVIVKSGHQPSLREQVGINVNVCRYRHGCTNNTNNSNNNFNDNIIGIMSSQNLALSLKVLYEVVYFGHKYINPCCIFQYRGSYSRPPLTGRKIETHSGDTRTMSMSDISDNSNNNNNPNNKGVVYSNSESSLGQDLSVQEVTCKFVFELICRRREILTKHRREQLDIFAKILSYTMENRGNDDKSKSNNKTRGGMSSSNAPHEDDTKQKHDMSNILSSSTTCTISDPHDLKHITTEELQSVLLVDESELLGNRIITPNEWITYSHARPEYDDGVLIIDCRTLNQIISWGIIEGSKVIPVHELYNAFKLNPDEFLQEYGFPIPKTDQKIVLYCQYGQSSLMGGQILHFLGYECVCHMREGYYAWAKQYNSLLKRMEEEDQGTVDDTRRMVILEAAKRLQREYNI